MKKRFAVRALSALLFVFMLLPYGTILFNNTVSVYGDTTKDLNDAENEKKNINDKINDTNKQIESLKQQASSTEEYIRQLDARMAEVDGSLYTLNSQINSLSEQIGEAEQKLSEAEEDSSQQYEKMKLRIKFMYEHNEESYLAILLSSQSIGELLNRAEYISKISSYDRQMLTQYQETVEYIAQTKLALETDYAELDEMKTSLEIQRESLEVMQTAKQTEMDNLKTQVAQQQQLQSSLYADLSTIEDDIAALEKKRKEEEQNNAHIDGGGGSGSTGQFIWPTISRRITSPYGDMEDRTSPHKGLDIGAVKPGVWGDPIYAADGGTVDIATYSSSAGNYIMIYHGNGLYTVYMHCSQLYVSKGDTVSKGQTIALMGSTGNSTGAHLHFGVRLNGAYVNPGPYLGTG